MKLRRSKEKILMAVWAVIVFGGLAASLGIFAANVSETWATTGKARKVSDWNFNIESVLHFDGGELGAASQNQGLREITYWQPIDQEYGLGYMNFSANARGIDHVCSSVVFYPEVGQTVYRDSDSNVERTKKKISLELVSPKNETGDWYHLPALFYKRPNGNKADMHKEYMCIFRANGNKGTRNDTNFVDHIGGAQYLGERYDVREYVSAAYGKGKGGQDGNYGVNGDNCPVIRVKGVNEPVWNPNASNYVIGYPDQPINNNRPYASVSRQCTGVTILEFHFYPHHTLENLDKNLKFTTITYRRKYHYLQWHSYPCGTEEEPRTCYYTTYETGYISSEKYNVYIGRSDPMSITYECPTTFQRGYDGSTYHNFTTEDLKACLDGTFQRYYLTSYSQISGLSPEALGRGVGTVSPRGSVSYDSDPNSRPYIPHDVYNQYLNDREVSFNGFLAVDDIDGSNEGYTPLKGVNRIFLTNKTRIRAKSIRSIFKPARWLGLYCSSSDPFCSKQWLKASNTKTSTSEDKNVSIYMQYTSTSDNPLTLAYYTNGHVSGIDSDGVPILYVVEDIQGYSNEDGGVVGTLKEKLEQYKKQYEEIYDEPLSITIETLKSNGMSNEESVNANTILIYLEAERFTQYDPYIINREILGDSDNEIPWYRDPALKNYIEPGVTDVIGTDEYIEPGVTNATKIVPSEWQGKNFAVYFTKISRIAEDYQNTCFSNNTSLKTE